MARRLVLAASSLLVPAFFLAGACSSSSGQAQCEAAGGQCVLGGAWCSNPGPQDCNPDRNPGGAFCCLSGLCTAPPVQAANYDQACTVDSDCVAVAEGNPCMACGLGCTSGATINVGALAKYRSDIANTPAALSVADGGCLDTCGTVSGRSDYGPFCCSGMCHVGGPCVPVDAGAEASTVTDATGEYANLCPVFGTQPTCPEAIDANACDLSSGYNCSADALPQGLPCSGVSQCQARIGPVDGCGRVDGWICSCIGGRWSCDNCAIGAAVCEGGVDAYGLPLR
jgi:hypothetical protein